MTISSYLRRPILCVLPAGLILAGALGGCGSDTAPSSGAKTSSDAAAAADSAAAAGGDSCQAQVELSGAVSDTWSGSAIVSTSSSDIAPPATYQTSHGDNMLTVASTGNGFDNPTIILQSGDDPYAVPAHTRGVTVAGDGSGAQVDAPAQAIASSESVQIKATFTC